VYRFQVCPRKLEIGQAGQFVNAFTVLLVHFINVQQGEPDCGWDGLEDLKWGLTCFLVLMNDCNAGKRASLPGLMKHREHWNRWERVGETAPLCHCFSLAKASLYRKDGREQDCSCT